MLTRYLQTFSRFETVSARSGIRVFRRLGRGYGGITQPRHQTVAEPCRTAGAALGLASSSDPSEEKKRRDGGEGGEGVSPARFLCEIPPNGIEFPSQFTGLLKLVQV